MFYNITKTSRDSFECLLFINLSSWLSLRLANRFTGGFSKIPANGLRHYISKYFFIKLRRNLSVFVVDWSVIICILTKKHFFPCVRVSVFIITIHQWENSKCVIDQSYFGNRHII